MLVLSDKQAYLDRYGAPDKAGLGMDTEEGWPVPYWDMDAAMAVMLMLLTAVDEGVGRLVVRGVPRRRGAAARPGRAARPAPRRCRRPRLAGGRRPPVAARPGPAPAAPFDEVVHRGRW